MSDSQIPESSATTSNAVQCAECGTSLDANTPREETDNGTFCISCFNNLTHQLQQVLAAQSQDVNYPMAVVGALAGAALGVLVWWGFTVTTEIAFGLIAIVIGIAVGKGAVMLSGNKRSVGLQGLSIAVSVVAYFYASYLVNRTFIHRAWETQGVVDQLPLVPGIGTLVQIAGLGFGFMDLVFLAIVVYEAWKIPAPMRMGSAS